MEKVTALQKRKRGRRIADAPVVERLRREKATVYYAALQSLVPTLFPKATRSKVIDETIKYIRHLEGELEFLKEQKEVVPVSVQPHLLLCQHYNTSTMDVTVSQNMTVFSMSFASGQPGLLTRVLQIFVMHLADVFMATVSEDISGVTHVTVAACVLDASSLEKIKIDLMAI